MIDDTTHQVAGYVIPAGASFAAIKHATYRTIKHATYRAPRDLEQVQLDSLCYSPKGLALKDGLDSQQLI